MNPAGRTLELSRAQAAVDALRAKSVQAGLHEHSVSKSFQTHWTL